MPACEAGSSFKLVAFVPAEYKEPVREPWLGQEQAGLATIATPASAPRHWHLPASARHRSFCG